MIGAEAIAEVEGGARGAEEEAGVAEAETGD